MYNECIATVVGDVFFGGAFLRTCLMRVFCFDKTDSAIFFFPTFCGVSAMILCIFIRGVGEASIADGGYAYT